MTPEELRQRFEDAKAALFRLEEALGPPGNLDRRRAYALRCEVGYLGGAILKHIEQVPHQPCLTCGTLTDQYTGGPPLTPEEQERVAAFNESFTGPNGEPLYHTGHLSTDLLRLPMHWFCSVHMPKE